MTSPTTNKFSPEVRDRAVRMVLDHEGEHPSRGAAIASIAGKIGCSPHTLLDWVTKADRDSGRSPGVPSDVAAKLKALERENRELRQANEILPEQNSCGRLCQANRVPEVMEKSWQHALQRHLGWPAGQRHA